MRKYWILGGLIMCRWASMAQLPATDIYGFEIIEGRTVKLSKPTYLSIFNKGGYNNQPYFLTPDKLLLSSNLNERDHTDIVQLNLRHNELEVLTHTTGVSEYSPKPMPSGSQFSVVQEYNKSQNLVAHYLNLNGESTLITPDINDIGYYQWLNDSEILCFRVTDPISFDRCNVNTGKCKTILNDVGRCFKATDDGQVLFVHKIAPDIWFIKKYNPIDGTIRVIAQTESEDFELLNSGTILIGRGSKLYKMSTDDNSWALVEDLSPYGIKEISRITVARNRLVLVSSK